MSTQSQSDYIAGLAVRKTKEFKEVKELIVSQGIASENAQTIADAGTIADVTNAMTDTQASQLIDALIATKDPARAQNYAQARVKKTIGTLDSIKTTISGWSFQ